MYLFLCTQPPFCPQPPRICMLHNQIISKIIPLKVNQVFNNTVYEK